MAEQNNYITDFDKLSNFKDEETIMSVLDKFIKEGNEFYEKIKPKFIESKNIANSYVDEEAYPLDSKYFLPLTARHIKTAIPDIFAHQFGERPFWGNFRVLGESEETIESQIINKLLEKNVYDHNPFNYEMHVSEKSKAIYGTSAIRDGWDFIERPVYKRNLIELTEEEIKEQKIELKEGDRKYREELEKITEVVKDANCFRTLSIHDCLFDPNSKICDRRHARFFGIKNYMDDVEVKKLFKNYKDYFDNRSGNKENSEPHTNPMQGTTHEEEKSQENRRQAYPVIYEIYTWDYCFWYSQDYKTLLIPKDTSDVLKFYNQYNHGEFPVCITWGEPDEDSVYGEGIVFDIGVLNLMINDFFNLLIEAVMKKLNPIPIINTRHGSPSKIMNALQGQGVPIELKGDANITSIDQVFKILDVNFHEGELAQIIDKIDGYMQLQSQQTNFRTGGTDVAGYNRTLGGIERILQQAMKVINYGNKINQDALKNWVYRMMSNIFQFQKEDTVLKIFDEKGTRFVEIRKRYNNLLDDEKEVLRENPETGRKIYYLDELAKLKYTFEIRFASGDGSLAYRLAELETALIKAIQLISFGVNPQPIIKEYFERLNVHGVVKLNLDEEMELIKEENDFFAEQVEIYTQMLIDGELGEDRTENNISYQRLIQNSVRKPRENENHALHLQNHPENMILHRIIHDNFLKQQEQIALELERQKMMAEQGHQQGSGIQKVDARSFPINEKRTPMLPTGE